MKKVKAYRCEHCGQLFMTEWRCKRHEVEYCKKNPQIRALCYGCKHYEPHYHEVETVNGYEDYLTYFGEEVPWTYEVNPSRCKACGCKLYNKRNMRQSRVEVLEDEGYVAMKTLRDGGCEHYEP